MPPLRDSQTDYAMQRKRQCRGWTYHLLIPLLCISKAVASASSSSSHSVSVVSNIDIQHAQQVKHLLTRRLYYVESGKRRKDFAKWVKQQGGQARVFSMHGVELAADDWMRLVRQDADDLDDDVAVSGPSPEVISKRRQQNKKHDPFPLERMSLDLPHDVRPYPLPQTEQYLDTPETPQSSKDMAKLSSSPSLLQLTIRAMVLSLHFGPVLSTLGVALVSEHFRNNYWYSWLTRCMAACGPAWIKWGQWSSTRNDMFPEALCDALSRLHSDAPAHSWQISREMLESSLHLAPNTLDLVFDEIETTPIASGSIAQVHRAILSGELVAVKIRHPRVQQLMELDFRLMGLVARAVDWLVIKFSGVGSQIQESVKQFSHTMAAQSYLQVEAHHLEVLNHNFRSWPQVRFPFPFFASDAVIIETFEPGRIVTSMIEQYQLEAEALRSSSRIPTVGNNRELVASTELVDYENKARAGVISELTAMESEVTCDVGNEVDSGFNRVSAHDLIPLDVAEFLVTTGLGLYLKMLLVDGLMHADLHPGNILIDASRTRQRQHLYSNTTKIADSQLLNSVVPRKRGSFLGITLVDAGMVAQLTERESSNFIGLLASIGEGNGREAASFALKFSLENDLDEQEREAFCEEMEALFQHECKGYNTDIDVGLVLRGILGLIRKHHVRIDANYATLVVNVLCIESLARNVCPSYNVLDAAKPLLRTYRRLCYNKDGIYKPNASKSGRVRAWMGLMYYIKRFRDSVFFKNESKRRKQISRDRLR